jgi:hypothetical protein
MPQAQSSLPPVTVDAPRQTARRAAPARQAAATRTQTRRQTARTENETSSAKHGLKENVMNPGNRGDAALVTFQPRKTFSDQDTDRHQGGNDKQRDDKKPWATALRKPDAERRLPPDHITGVIAQLLLEVRQLVLSFCRPRGHLSSIKPSWTWRLSDPDAASPARQKYRDQFNETPLSYANESRKVRGILARNENNPKTFGFPRSGESL